MSYSRRQLEAFGEPFGDSCTQSKAGGGRIYGGGGGGSQQQSTQITDLPDWAKTYAKEGLAQAAALTDINQNPYQPYTGSRQAGFDPLQEQAFLGAAGMTAAPQMGQATGMATEATNRLLNTQYTPTDITNQYQRTPDYQTTQFQNQFQAPTSYSPTQFTNQYQSQSPYQTGDFQNRFAAPQQYDPTQFTNQFQAPRSYETGNIEAERVKAQQLEKYAMGPAERVGTEKFGSQSAQDYMNPYMQNVVDIQKREAQRQADIAGTQRGAAAVKAGAFGGSRQAIMEAEAQRNLSQQMGDIQARGSQEAYDRAAQMFTSDQARELAAQQANQQAGLTTGQANLQAALGVQSLGAQTGLQAALANQQTGLTAQQAREASRQFGAGQDMTAAQLQAQYGLSAQQASEAAKQFGAGQQMTAAQLEAQYGLSADQAREASRQFGAGQAATDAQMRAQYGQEALRAQEAANQFGAGQAMTAAQLQAQYGLSAEQAAEASKQFGANQQARQAEMEAQYGQSAQQLREQANQYGAGLGIQGLTGALTGAGQLANIGQQQFGQVMDINKLQNEYGTQRQAQEQAGLDTAYQDFLNQQRFPYQQLEFMNSMLRGTPMGTVSSMYAPGPSAMSQLAGLGTAAYGLSRMKEGGEVRPAGLAELALKKMA